MSSPSPNPVLRHLRALSAQGVADAALLERFVRDRSDDAFAAIIERHGPMVLGVARRVLGDAHLAEDVFQATFLVLARRAESIRRRDALAGWLHGVAHRLALKARSRSIRASRPDPRPKPESSDPADELTWRELRRVLDDELARLPEQYRLPLVLCHFEGLTRDEAAARLGWGVQRVKGLLERGRERLRLRLLKRGLTLSAALTGPLLADRSRAEVPSLLTTSAVSAGLKFAAGATLPACGVGPAVASLTYMGMKTMTHRIAKMAAAAVLLLGLAGAGLWALPQEKSAKTRPAKPAEATVAKWTEIRSVPFENMPITRLAFSPDGKQLCGTTRSGRFCWWRMADWKEVPGRKAVGNVGGIGEFAGFGSDGAPRGVISVVGPKGSTLVYTISTLKARFEGKPDSGGVVRQEHWELEQKFSAVLAPDVPDGANPMRDRMILPPEFPRFAVGEINPSGDVLAAADSKAIYLLETEKGRLLAKIDHDHLAIHTMRFSPDGHWLAIGWGTAYPVQGQVNGGIDLWDVGKLRSDGMMKHTQRLTTPETMVTCIAFSPDGKTVAGCGMHGTALHLWDTASGEGRIIKRPEGAAPFLAVAYFPDGKSLLLNWRDPDGAGCGATVWDIEKGREVAVLKGMRDNVQAVAVAPDGKMIAAGDGRGTVKVWRLE